ncbi:MAG: hypothetical protein KOO63_05765 [Bacteroidales bacterium]|nr:hypothetical protein [Candidatus Latescibacterota bacterium]
MNGNGLTHEKVTQIIQETAAQIKSKIGDDPYDFGIIVCGLSGYSDIGKLLAIKGVSERVRQRGQQLSR